MNEPKIVVFDIETLPDMKQAMKVWPQLSNYPGLTLKASISSIICIGYKIIGEDKIGCINAWDYSRWNKNINDDFSVCNEFSKVLKNADAVVTHNGKKFDFKHLQTRVFKNGLDPLPKLHHIDTRDVARKHLLLFNNRLGTVGDFLLGDKKLENQGWDLWVAVANKEKWAMDLMTKYCKQDVNLTYKAFTKLKPVISSIPNYNLFTATDRNVCPNCGSTRLKSHGRRTTKTRSYRRSRCLDCLTFSRTDLKDKNPRQI